MSKVFNRKHIKTFNINDIKLLDAKMQLMCSREGSVFYKVVDDCIYIFEIEVKKISDED